MTTRLRAVVVCLVLATSAGTALADFCPTCKDGVGVAAIGKCANCGKQIPSQTQKLCADCSRKLGQCETCRGPLAPASQPATRPAN